MGRSVALDAHGDAHAAADAQRRQALFCVALLHFMDQRHQNPRAGRADGMADRDRPAIDIELFPVPTELLADRQRLGGKGFISFDQIQTIDRPSRLLQRRPAGRDRTGSHDRGIDAGLGLGFNARERRDAALITLFAGHQHQCGGAVVDSRGVASRHRAVAGERGAKLAERLGRGAMGRVFVLGHGDVAPAGGKGDGDDFILESFRLLRRFRLVLGPGRERILFLAGNLPLFSDVFSRVAHVVAVKRIPQPVPDHGVDHFRVAQFRPLRRWMQWGDWLMLSCPPATTMPESPTVIACNPMATALSPEPQS